MPEESDRTKIIVEQQLKALEGYDISVYREMRQQLQNKIDDMVYDQYFGASK